MDDLSIYPCPKGRASSRAIAERYKALGGHMELIILPGKGHEYDPGFFESQKMLDFIVENGVDE